MSIQNFKKVDYPWAANKHKLNRAFDELIAEGQPGDELTEAAVRERYVSLKGPIVPGTEVE